GATKPVQEYHNQKDPMKLKLAAFFCLALFLAGAALAMGEKTAAPDFTLSDLAGQKVKLSSYKGKVILLNFWATWCSACRVEMPGLQKLSEKLKNRNFVVLAVALDRDEKAVKPFIFNNGYSFPVLLDPAGRAARSYNITAIPTTFIINKKGQTVERRLGAIEWTDRTVVKRLEKLIGE
ncbi:MAG: TlpA disulfide reductase family protein, partial [Candidatus Margulisbacteria bacterium]|nr:TlpA disulfide reductase family protein [Candidatus Margulisiibacteriota bacterium]